MNKLESTFKNFPYRLILGSASPRRQELLKGLGFEFSVEPIHADESFPADLMAEQIPLYLANKKAESYSRALSPDQLLITADTVVWCENKVFNKPEDFEEGKKMLRELSGRMHQVFTAVCLRNSSKKKLFYDESKVFFKPFSDDEIVYYLTHYKPYDKAGAYGVQEWLGYSGITRIEGSFYNVMGLPVQKLYEELLRF